MSAQIAYNLATGPAEAKANELMQPSKPNFTRARETCILVWNFFHVVAVFIWFRWRGEVCIKICVFIARRCFIFITHVIGRRRQHDFAHELEQLLWSPAKCFPSHAV